MTTPLDLVRRLRWPIFLLLLAAATGAGIVATATERGRRTDADHRRAVAEREDIRSKLARAQEEAQEIRRRISRYQELVDRGYIGQERRLEWVERIAQVKAARGLVDVRYELGPQHSLGQEVLPEGAVAGGHEFMASTMNLQMQLLHEGDLLNFLADIRPGVQAFLHVRACGIERIPRGGEERGPRPNLRAECTIDWITLREKP